MNKVQFEIRSRLAAKNFTCDKPWAAISVSTRPECFPELSTVNQVGLLQLGFWDISQPKTYDARLAGKLFTKEQAKQVLDFANEMMPKIETMLVHCEMGLSRSPAIAAALENIFYGKGSEATYFNKYIPNVLVYKTITEVYYGSSEGAQIARQFGEIDSNFI